MKTILTFLFLLPLIVFGQDITAGYTFHDGQRITAAQLHQLVNQAVINPVFYTGKIAQTNVNTSDVLLVYSPASGTFHKISATTALLGNPDLISDKVEYTSVNGTNYYFLGYDSTADVLFKVGISNLLYSGMNTIPFSNMVNDVVSSSYSNLSTVVSNTFAGERIFVGSLSQNIFIYNDTNSPNTKLSVNWGTLVVQSGLLQRQTLETHVTLDISAGRGTNKLDSASTWKANTWYQVVALANQNQSVAILSEPVGGGCVAAVDVGGSDFTNFTASGYWVAGIGWARTDSSSNFLRFSQVGQQISIAPQMVLSNGAGIPGTWSDLTSPSSNAIPCWSFVSGISGVVGLSSTNMGGTNAQIAITGSTNTSRFVWGGNAGASGVVWSNYCASSPFELQANAYNYLQWQPSVTNAVYGLTITGFKLRYF